MYQCLMAFYSKTDAHRIKWEFWTVAIELAAWDFFDSQLFLRIRLQLKVPGEFSKDLELITP